MDNQEILRRLRTTRVKLGLTPKAMSQALGCKGPEYAQKENGKSPISTDEWLKIAEALNLPVETFFIKDPGCKETLMLINGYNRLSEKKKRTIIAVLNALLLSQWSEFKEKANNDRKSSLAEGEDFGEYNLTEPD